MKKSRNDIVFGSRSIIEAINNGKEIDKVLIKKGQSNELTDELIDALKQFRIPTQYVPIEKLNSITTKNHQGCIAFISPITYCNLEEIVMNTFEEGRNPFLLVLDEISDVRNFGAIARTAECFGVDAIIIPSRGAAQINSDSIKTSAGALLKIPVCREHNLLNTIHYLKSSGIRTLALTEKANKKLQDISFEGPLAIILGSEDEGISPDFLRIADEQVAIHMVGTIESLNVSVSAAIVMHEALNARLS